MSSPLRQTRESLHLATKGEERKGTDMEASQWNIRSPAYSNVHVPYLLHGTALCTPGRSRTASQPATASLHSAAADLVQLSERVLHKSVNTSTSMNRRAKEKHWLLA